MCEVYQVWMAAGWQVPVGTSGTELNSLVLQSIEHFLYYLLHLSKLKNVTTLRLMLIV
jgi:hypothetical protein